MDESRRDAVLALAHAARSASEAAIAAQEGRPLEAIRSIADAHAELRGAELAIRRVHVQEVR